MLSQRGWRRAASKCPGESTAAQGAQHSLFAIAAREPALEQCRRAVSTTETEGESEPDHDSQQHDQEGLLDQPAADVEVIDREQDDEDHQAVLREAAEQIGVADARAAQIAADGIASETREVAAEHDQQQRDQQARQEQQRTLQPGRG